jgi:hypothetical protein
MRTREQETEFIIEMLKVQLEFAKDIVINLKIPFSEAINNFTIIQEFTDFNTGDLFGVVDAANVEWLDIISGFSIYTDTNQLVSVLLPFTYKRVAINIEYFNKMYNNEWSKNHSCIFQIEKGDEVEIHLHNNFYPESFLEYSLERDIKVMLENLKPNIKTITCTSWLNDLGRFYKMFPSSWKASETWYDYIKKPGLGIFGQFINKNYEINSNVVDYYIRNRKLKYLMKNCTCSVKDLKYMYKD